MAKVDRKKCFIVSKNSKESARMHNEKEQKIQTQNGKNKFLLQFRDEIQIKMTR